MYTLYNKTMGIYEVVSKNCKGYGSYCCYLGVTSIRVHSTLLASMCRAMCRSGTLRVITMVKICYGPGCAS